ncbi:hypothetical protein evm_005206 [Chilo suppressalis]|nr:hypothetical protein evm_005206 [Chilo suppressalis]
MFLYQGYTYTKRAVHKKTSTTTWRCSLNNEVGHYVELTNGKQVLIVDGYQFYRRGPLRKCTAYRWCCRNKNCRVYLHVDDDLRILRRLGFQSSYFQLAQKNITCPHKKKLKTVSYWPISKIPHQQTKRRRKQTKEERLEKKREAERRRYQRMKSDPIKLAEMQEKERQKYYKKKLKLQRKSINDMSPISYWTISKITHQQAKRRRKQTKEERLEKKRGAERRRYHRMRSDPIKHAEMQEKQRQKYLEKKLKLQKRTINDMSQSEKKATRKKWREHCRKYRGCLATE